MPRTLEPFRTFDSYAFGSTMAEVKASFGEPDLEEADEIMEEVRFTYASVTLYFIDNEPGDLGADPEEWAAGFEGVLRDISVDGDDVVVEGFHLTDDAQVAALLGKHPHETVKDYTLVAELGLLLGGFAKKNRSKRMVDMRSEDRLPAMRAMLEVQ